MANVKQALLLSLFLAIATVSCSNLYEVADQMLQQLDALVQEALAVNLPVLSLLPKELLTIGDSLYARAETDIVTYKTQVLKQVYDLVPEAEELGHIDLELLANCTERLIPELDFIQVIVLLQINACIDKTTEYGTNLVNQAIQDIENSQDVVKRLELHLDQCSLIGTDECVLPVIEAIGVELVDLPARIDEDATRTKAVVKALETTYFSCAADRVGTVQNLGEQLVINIRTCAKMPV